MFWETGRQGLEKGRKLMETGKAVRLCLDAVVSYTIAALGAVALGQTSPTYHSLPSRLVLRKKRAA
ncbi:hypothetical protein L209DRAFT_757386 [Thermothelomyces heterothallicus CBS 203.75]